MVRWALHRAWAWLLGVVLLSLPLSLWAAPQVVTTIKPIDDLVRAVMAGVAEPVRLIPSGASPHTYMLKPSDRQALAQADLIIWIGPEIESALPTVFPALPSRVRVVTVKALPGVTLLPARHGGAWEGHTHEGHSNAHDHHSHEPDHHHAHQPHHDHGHEAPQDAKVGIDGHLWLSPANAIAIIQGVAAILHELDPAHGAAYRANAEQAVARLKALDRALKEQLAPLANRPFLVFHDAYQYFEQAFGLYAVGSIIVRPDAPPGAKRLAELRERIVQQNVLCLFAEPQFEPKLVRSLVAGTPVRAGTLDPLGVDLPAGLDGYEALLKRLATQLSACLLGSGPAQVSPRR